MRPLIVLLSTLIIIATLALAYFASPQVISSGTVTSTSSNYLTVAPAADPLSFLGNLPLTFNYHDLPSGQTVRVYVCPSADTQAQCLNSNSDHFDMTAAKGSMTVLLTGSQMLLIHTVAQGLAYSVTAPVWSLYSTLFIVLAVAGLAALVVGLILKPASRATRYEPQQSPAPASPSPVEEPVAPEEQAAQGSDSTPPWSEDSEPSPEGGDQRA